MGCSMVAGLCQLILASKSVRRLAHQKPQTHKQAKNKNTKQSIRANESSAKRMGADHPPIHNVPVKLKASDCKWYCTAATPESTLESRAWWVGSKIFLVFKENFNKSQPSLPEFEPRLQTT